MASNCCIKIRQENDNRLEQLYSWIPFDLFNIKLDFRYVSPLNSETTLETYNQSVTYPRDMFLSEEYGPKILLSMFSRTGASPEFLQIIIDDILSIAWEIDADPVNLGRKVIKVVVEVVVQENDDEDDDQVIDESLSALNFKPASSSSIQALKRVKYSDDEDDHLLPPKKRRRLEGLTSTTKKQCTICLDEFSEGEEVASMPCGHVFHDGCIVKWLETSHLCPLCRYQMPT